MKAKPRKPRKPREEDIELFEREKMRLKPFMRRKSRSISLPFL
jgi:hypothetical protein